MGGEGFVRFLYFSSVEATVNALERFPLVAEDLNTAGGSIPRPPNPVTIPPILDKINEKLRQPVLPFQ